MRDAGARQTEEAQEPSPPAGEAGSVGPTGSGRPAGRGPGAPALAATSVVKVYGAGPTAVRALDGVTVEFDAGAFTAIMGPSGSGKSTLMHCLAGLDTVTSGSIRIGGTEITQLSDRALTLLRRTRVGFVFQSFNLLPTLTAEQNIRLPGELSGTDPDPAWWDRVIGTLGIADRLRRRPGELSGGEQQRVACARALVTRPDVVFADEPTGNLDTAAGDEVLSFLRTSVTELGQTVVLVTHDPRAAAYADRVVFLRDGRIVDELRDAGADRILDELKKLEA